MVLTFLSFHGKIKNKTKEDLSMFDFLKPHFLQPTKSKTFDNFGQYLAQNQVEVYNSRTGEKFVALIDKNTTCQQNLHETVYTLQYNKADLDKLNLKMRPTIFNGTDVIVGKRVSLNEYVDMKVVIEVLYNDQSTILQDTFPIVLKQGRRIINYVIDHNKVVDHVFKTYNYNPDTYTINSVNSENGTLFLSVSLPTERITPIYKNNTFMGFVTVGLTYTEVLGRISPIHNRLDHEFLADIIELSDDEIVKNIDQVANVHDEIAIQIITEFNYEPYLTDPVYKYTQYLKENDVIVPEELLQNYLTNGDV